jgi:hypothetical protein
MLDNTLDASLLTENVVGSHLKRQATGEWLMAP